MDADAKQNPFYCKQPSSSTYTYFREQAIRVGSQSGSSGGGGHVGPMVFGGPWEAIQREREKDKIRAEIIAEEMARKRILEAEVRNELRIEREMAMRSGGGFLPPSMQPNNNNFERRILHRQPIGLEERIGMSLEKHHPRGGNCFAFRGFEVAPFQRLRDSPKIESIPTPLPEDTKKEAILLGNEFIVFQPAKDFLPAIQKMLTEMRERTKDIQEVVIEDNRFCLSVHYRHVKDKGDESQAGTKRKSAPVVAENPSKPHSGGPKKKLKEEWSCAICQVSATSERGLTEHLQGKKHQIKEAALIAQKSGANFGLGVSPIVKPKPKPVKLSLTSANSTSSEKKSKTKSRKETSNSLEVKKSEKYKFWCEMCEVGAFSEKVMNHHKGGKKHLTQLVKLLQKGKVEESETNKTVVGDDFIVKQDDGSSSSVVVKEVKKDDDSSSVVVKEVKKDDDSSSVVVKEVKKDDGSSGSVVVKEVKQDDGSSGSVVVKEVKQDDDDDDDDDSSSVMVVVDEEEKSEVKEVIEDASIYLMMGL